MAVIATAPATSKMTGADEVVVAMLSARGEFAVCEEQQKKKIIVRKKALNVERIT